ncbi:hypothetical protein NEOLEDRAFT_535911 [Neolentinus lepideus HHB14362 ss-1]|uniref:F-box domain-containing protein n=1 Tax=Neolentinus lepideus HHB14362 ss-1 TaxID=1314782 RepID=A0A165RAN7_9AGAM|nr:hypothetical protein NEOLEDRAFT_535911 [Neolentinus lepideus HHB14362 ss-1]
MRYPSSWWTPPRRKRDHQELVQIPHDVWLEVVENLRPSESLSRGESKYDLANLSLACRYLCAITRPLLYEEVLFSGTSVTNDVDLPLKDHSQWYKEVRSRNDSLGSFVKIYRLNDWIVSDDRRAFISTFCKKHFDVVARLPKLQSLYLSGFDAFMLNPLREFLCRRAKAGPQLSTLRHLYLYRADTTINILAALQELTGLETLVLHDSYVSCALDERLPKSILPCLRHLEVNTVWYPLDYTFSTAIIHMACQASLRTLSTNVSYIAHALLTCDVGLAIEDLQVFAAPEDMPLFASFLGRTPSIHTLSFGLADPVVESPPLDLDNRALPNLRSLSCSGTYILPAAKGRPIRRYCVVEYNPTLETDDYRLPALLGLKQSSAPVEELGVRATLYHDTVFAQHFPNLKSVTVFPDRRGMSVKLVKNEVLPWEHLQLHCAIDATQFAKELVPGRDYTYDLPTQRGILANNQFMAQFPSLLGVKFHGLVDWRRSSHTSDNWEPYISSRDKARSNLKNLAAGRIDPDVDPVHVVDEDGILASLFRPQEMTTQLRELLGLENSSNV